MDAITGVERKLTGQAAIDILKRQGWKCIRGNWILPTQPPGPPPSANIFVGAIIGLGASGIAVSAACNVQAAQHNLLHQIDLTLNGPVPSTPGAQQTQEGLQLAITGNVPLPPVRTNPPERKGDCEQTRGPGKYLINKCFKNGHYYGVYQIISKNPDGSESFRTVEELLPPFPKTNPVPGLPHRR